MATLVLSAVGSIIGGPIGGAIGAIIGQQVDQAIFAPPGRQGPRLNDLAAQTSSYGSKIPKLYGAMRVSGTVIWATDLQEHSSTSGGKGQPKVTSYSYSASFAVALSARRILRIGRIWADGKLLRGVAGDFKTQTGFRFYPGDENQTVDPLIAGAEGIGNTPAYRGQAYVVFQDMALANYGNRIPSLSFEVFADTGDVALEQIIRDLVPNNLIVHCPTSFGGYAASGDSARGAIETLTAAVPVRVADDGIRLSVVEAEATLVAPSAADFGATIDRSRGKKFAVAHQSASMIPQTLVMAYYDPARDYQQGMQRARRAAGARREQRLDLPVTLASSEAKLLVESRLNTIWAARATAKVQLPWRHLAIRPGDNLLVPGSADVWRVSAVTVNHMVLAVDLVRTTQATPLRVPADAGRSVNERDLPAGPTTVAILDLPQLTDGVATAPALVVAAAGISPGWRVAMLSQSLDDGISWQDAGATAPRAIIGAALTSLDDASTCLIDTKNSVDVRVLNTEMMLADASDDLLLSGANIAMLGGELLQFGRAVPVGSGVYRLSRLWRGRRGTEDRTTGHAVNDRFVLIDSHTLLPLSVPSGVAHVRVQAQGVGDADAALSDFSSPGLALRPPAPVRLTATLQPNGDIALTWIRRSRDGWRWQDGVDAPLAEQQEQYALSFMPSAGQSRQIQSATTSALYTAAQIAADKVAGATSVLVAVRQIGTQQTSLPAIITLSL
jgi:hypothetical protein